MFSLAKIYLFILFYIVEPIQIQLVRLLVGLVGKLIPSFSFVWYDLPTNV